MVKIQNFGPNHRAVHVGNRIFFFSYDTLVAFAAPFIRVRRATTTATTAKHLTQMGCGDYDRHPEGAFEEMVQGETRWL